MDPVTTFSDMYVDGEYYCIAIMKMFIFLYFGYIEVVRLTSVTQHSCALKVILFLVQVISLFGVYYLCLICSKEM